MIWQYAPSYAEFSAITDLDGNHNFLFLLKLREAKGNHFQFFFELDLQLLLLFFKSVRVQFGVLSTPQSRLN